MGCDSSSGTAYFHFAPTLNLRIEKLVIIKWHRCQSVELEFFTVVPTASKSDLFKQKSDVWD